MHGFFLRNFMVAEILSDLAEQIWIDDNLLPTSVFSIVLCLCDAFLVTLLKVMQIEGKLYHIVLLF